MKQNLQNLPRNAFILTATISIFVLNGCSTVHSIFMPPRENGNYESTTLMQMVAEYFIPPFFWEPIFEQCDLKTSDQDNNPISVNCKDIYFQQNENGSEEMGDDKKITVGLSAIDTNKLPTPVSSTPNPASTSSTNSAVVPAATSQSTAGGTQQNLTQLLTPPKKDVGDFTTFKRTLFLTLELPLHMPPADRIIKSRITADLDDSARAAFVSWDTAVTQYTTITPGTISNVKTDNATMNISSSVPAWPKVGLSGVLSTQNATTDTVNLSYQVESLNVLFSCDFPTDVLLGSVPFEVLTHNDLACQRGKYDEMIVAKSAMVSSTPVSGNTIVNVTIKLGIDNNEKLNVTPVTEKASKDEETIKRHRYSLEIKKIEDSLTNINANSISIIDSCSSDTVSKQTNPTLKVGTKSFNICINSFTTISEKLRANIKKTGGVKADVDVEYLVRHVNSGGDTVQEGDDSVSFISYFCHINQINDVYQFDSDKKIDEEIKKHNKGYREDSPAPLEYLCNVPGVEGVSVDKYTFTDKGINFYYISEPINSAHSDTKLSYTYNKMIDGYHDFRPTILSYSEIPPVFGLYINNQPLEIKDPIEKTAETDDQRHYVCFTSSSDAHSFLYKLKEKVKSKQSDISKSKNASKQAEPLINYITLNDSVKELSEADVDSIRIGNHCGIIPEE